MAEYGIATANSQGNASSISNTVKALESINAGIKKAKAQGKSDSDINAMYNLDSITRMIDSVTNQVNYDNPSSVLMNAASIASANTYESQALAREQMEFQEQANAKAMAFNASEAQKTRDWQQLMSDTAHQREVKDLIAAGLNPILSANQGASTGTAGSAQGVTSAGAKGTVDMSTVDALTNIYKQVSEIDMQAKSLDMEQQKLDFSKQQLEANMLMNQMNNETNRYMADKSAGASIIGSSYMASANRYGADMSNLAQKYVADLNYQTYSEGLHGTAGQTGQYVEYKANQLANDLAAGEPGTAVNSAKGTSDVLTSLGNVLKGIFTNYDSSERVRR